MAKGDICNRTSYIMRQFFLLLGVTNGVELGVYLSKGRISEFRLHAGLSFEEDGSEDRLDLRYYGAYMIWSKMAKPVIRLRFDRAIDIQQRDILRSACEAESARRAFLGPDETGFDQRR